MSNRHAVPWILGLGLIFAATAGLAVACNWWGADLQSQAFVFYSGLTDGAGVSEEVYRHWDTISTRGSSVAGLATPLLMGSLVAVFSLLAVLARRWDVTRGAAPRRAASDQDEATAAS